jgi:glycerol-3-phosphate acyltransferase PlsY
LEYPFILHLGFYLAAYLLGSFSSAITLSKIMRFPDPRSEGSNNPGATNVLRIAGKKAAALTLLGDLLKGFVPVLIASLVLEHSLSVAVTGFCAFLGHCFPVFYRFSGGKGVATAIGFILAFDWISATVLIGVWLMVAKVFKLSSLAAIIAFLVMPAFHFWLFRDVHVSGILSALSLILILRHKDNIRRLLQGQEHQSKLKQD